MSNRINTFLNGSIHPYRRTASPRESAPAQKASEAPKPATARNAASAVPGPPLSPEEQQMIAREFPPRPALSLRLYGPGSDSRTVTPRALGSRLDLRA